MVENRLMQPTGPQAAPGKPRRRVRSLREAIEIVQEAFAACDIQVEATGDGKVLDILIEDGWVRLPFAYRRHAVEDRRPVSDQFPRIGDGAAGVAPDRSNGRGAYNPED
jgi:hypothetical protein